MPRPDHLPDFTKPPLDEVVLGVQFTPPSGYTSVHSGNIWHLFDEEFPNIQEHPPLAPAFETFGGINPQPGLQFSLGPAPLRGRLWFISKDDDHLIQFQEDRFILNWRKRQNHQVYPRFEAIAKSFSDHLKKLELYFLNKLSHQIEINQAEITYINIVNVEDYAQLGNWFSIWRKEQFKIDSLTTNFSEVIADVNGNAFARLHHEILTVETRDKKNKAYRLSLTFRGLPPGKDKESSMKFIEAGRDKIVTRFNEITTDEAHKIWGKK